MQLGTRDDKDQGRTRTIVWSVCRKKSANPARLYRYAEMQIRFGGLMAVRSRRRLWRQVAIGCCLVWAVTSLAGATAASQGSREATHLVGASLRVLQLNLCDSGIARCYTGRSVHQAAEVIRAEQPDIVTLNEICRDDLPVLQTALSDAKRGGLITSAFEAAVDRRTAAAFRCRNGQPYGVGVLARVGPQNHGYRLYSEVYPIQDTRDPEQRVWLCLHAISDFYACTTHLASTSSTVALGQCGYLLHTAIPDLRAQGGQDPMVLGGDFNLSLGGSRGAHACLPPGYRHTTDGGTQYVVDSAGLTVASSRSISMRGTTDHPGLLVDLNIT
jgi:hypothetical protein